MTAIRGCRAEDHDEIVALSLRAWAPVRGCGRRACVAVIGTGGDLGHAPARRVYARLGFRPFPSAQYFRALPPS